MMNTEQEYLLLVAIIQIAAPWKLYRDVNHVNH